MACVRLHQKTWKADFRDQHGRRRLESPKGPFITKAEEKRAARELLSLRLEEVRAGRYKHGKEKPTFSRLADLWITSKVRLRVTTVMDYKTELDVYLKPFFGARVADEITAWDIEQFRNALKDGVPSVIQEARKVRHPNLKPLQNPGPRVINKLLTRINGIMKYGCRHKFLSGANPAQGIEKLRVAGTLSSRIQENVLMPHELQRLVDECVDPWRGPIMAAVYTGARKGEIIALKWDDIDWSTRTARIERSYSRGTFLPPKTLAGRRVIELPDVLINELKRWQLQCSKDELDLVFPSAKGGPMDGFELLRTGFRPALERAGIRRIRFHDLRHSFASNLLAAGWDVVTVSRLLGHANPQVTLTIYAHALPRSRHGAADALAKLMRADTANQIEAPA
jgi:integrase